MLRKFLLVFVTVLMIAGFAQTSQAVLNAVDPGVPTYLPAFGNFPQWYQDTSALALDLCLSPAVGPNGALCTLLADPGFNPALPIAFPTNYPFEGFYFDLGATVTGPGITSLKYLAALEATFAAASVVDGTQITFSRIRIVGAATAAGTYVITHPYGEEVIKIAATGARSLNVTHDVGVAAGIFTGALKGAIGPFVKAATGFITVGTEQFIGDVNITQTVVGSPFGTNFVRVSGPAGIIQTDLFTLMGKVSAAVLPTPLIVDRTTYSSNAAQTQIDVFAISAPTATVTFDVTGAALVPMGGDILGKFFGQALVPPATLSPVTITATNLTSTATISPASALTDVVFITRAEYSLSAGTLAIEASSSDETAASQPLTATGFGSLATALVAPTFSGSFTAVIPPASVTVTSAAGGSDTEDVVVVP